MTATLVSLAAHAAAGALLGLAYFALLRAGTRRLARGDGVAQVLGLAALRLALVVAGLALATRAGALPLVATALGLLIGRAAVMRRAAGDAR